MKRIIILIFFISLFMVNQRANAKVYLDLMAQQVDTDDAETQYGFVGNVGMEITPNIDFLFRGAFSQYTKDKNKTSETDYDHKMYLGVIQYKYDFIKQPVSFNAAFGLGWTTTSIDIKNDASGLSPYDDSGVGYAFWIGSKYYLTQHVSPYAQVGYHKSLYSGDLDDASIGGYQLLVGISFTLFGKNIPLTGLY